MLYCNKYTITPVVRWCLEEILGLDDYQINVNYQVLLSSGGYFERPNLVYVSQHAEQPFHALFHELRHYYQYRKQMWDFNPKPFTKELPADWTPQKVSLERYFEYLQYPWELDAQEFAMKTVSQFWKSPVSFSFSSSPSESSSASSSSTRR